MATPAIPWSPRMILTGRVFRLPVQAQNTTLDLEANEFEQIEHRWSERDSAYYFYLRTPNTPGDYTVTAKQNGQTAQVTIQVRTLTQLRQPFEFNNAQWPRRWPVGQTYTSTKTRQTLQDDPQNAPDDKTLNWWTSQTDETLYKQLPLAEIPRAHFVNAHQGSPTVGTAVFRHGGFYPWKRNHLPSDFKSICPVSGDVFPSNNLMDEDYHSGQYPDDGYGYFDEDGNIFLFAATYARDQMRAFGRGIGVLTDALRQNWNDDTARTLGLMLLRYAFEECYVAAVPQFRYGPSKGVEEPWDWGQPDWATKENPIEALARMGTLRYSIDTPYLAETVALAYDTLWPFLQKDTSLIERAKALDIPVESSEDVIQLLEEMLASLLQCILDRGASSNLPRESQGALSLLRALDRPDAQDVMDWLYDDGPDTLRVFTQNNFFPDGFPPESTGGYNSIHINGVFDVEDQIRKFRALHPTSYTESAYPSLMSDARAPRIAQASHEVTMGGKTFFQFGDGSAPGSSSQLGGQPGQPNSLVIGPNCFHAPQQPSTIKHAVAFTDHPILKEIDQAIEQNQHRQIGTTIHDSVGIAILRTSEAPERAAMGVVYGDTTGHRHRDLLDVQLFAFGRPYFTDLGYPQSWASIGVWEAHWATHNSIWGVIEAEHDTRVAGRGRLVRSLLIDGVQALDIEANRWSLKEGIWAKTPVTYRRLLALVETDDNGIALVDLSRIWGGVQHWRICRGIEGAFHANELNFTSQTGTVAGPEIQRGEIEKCQHPDDTALAYMDNVQTAEPPKAWQGHWQSRIESQVGLDVHQVNISDNTEFLTARATAMMGTPEESSYNFSTALWRRKPSSETEATHVDLVFEPHTGNPTLQSVENIAQDSNTSAVRLTTKKGRQIDIHWSPSENGGITVSNNKKIFTLGTSPIDTTQSQKHTRTIQALDRDACTIDIEPIDNLSVGDVININPQRGHMYQIENIENISQTQQRLTLNVTSLLGRCQILSIQDKSLHLKYHVMARTGNLNNTHLTTDDDTKNQRIVSANNTDRQTTTVLVAEDISKIYQVNNWVQIVDYVIGDAVTFEPLQQSE